MVLIFVNLLFPSTSSIVKNYHQAQEKRLSDNTNNHVSNIQSRADKRDKR